MNPEGDLTHTSTMSFPDLILDLPPELLGLILTKLNYYHFAHHRRAHRAFLSLSAPKSVREHFQRVEDLDKGDVLSTITVRDITQKSILREVH